MDLVQAQDFVLTFEKVVPGEHQSPKQPVKNQDASKADGVDPGYQKKLTDLSRHWPFFIMLHTCNPSFPANYILGSIVPNKLTGVNRSSQ